MYHILSVAELWLLLYQIDGCSFFSYHPYDYGNVDIVWLDGSFWGSVGDRAEIQDHSEKTILFWLNSALKPQSLGTWYIYCIYILGHNEIQVGSTRTCQKEWIRSLAAPETLPLLRWCKSTAFWCSISWSWHWLTARCGGSPRDWLAKPATSTTQLCSTEKPRRIESFFLGGGRNFQIIELVVGWSTWTRYSWARDFGLMGRGFLPRCKWLQLLWSVRGGAGCKEGN